MVPGHPGSVGSTVRHSNHPSHHRHGHRDYICRSSHQPHWILYPGHDRRHLYHERRCRSSHNLTSNHLRSQTSRLSDPIWMWSRSLLPGTQPRSPNGPSKTRYPYRRLTHVLLPTPQRRHLCLCRPKHFRESTHSTPLLGAGVQCTDD